MKLIPLTAVTALLSGYIDPTQAQANDPLVINCLQAFGFTGGATASAPWATASGGTGALTISSNPPDAIGRAAVSITVATPQVIQLGTFTVVDQAGAQAQCDATLTIVDPLRIVCKGGAVGRAPPGGQGTVTVFGPLAVSSGGVEPVTILPNVLNAITLTGPVGATQTFTYTATDAVGNTATCAVTLIIAGECGDDDICGDPHMKGLRGQSINWSGIDGGWYCLIKDDELDLQVNVRLTAPLPGDFPDRQLITGLSILSEGHSLAIEVKNPYSIGTDGCPHGISPCLANGGLRAVVDEEEVVDLLRFSRVENVADGISLSASNLPVECRKFGGDKIWARMYEKMLHGKRRLAIDDSFEDWILTFHNMAAPDWCAKFILENDLSDLQSTHAIFKIETSTVTVRLNVGINYQVGGELGWDGRVLPDLEFWQMDVGLDGLLIENPSLSGILGETARPVLDENGREVMEGFEAFRGTVEDYRVSGSLGTRFSLLDKTEEAHI